MIGKPAPAFSLKDQDGKNVALADLKGRHVVLFFYPKDDTPGCTKESCRFRDLKAEFARRNAIILGVSADDEASHRQFIGKFGLNFTLLCDPDRKVIQAYGAWGEKNKDGKISMGLIRSSVLIGSDGVVKHHWPKVADAEKHPDEVLAALSGLPHG